MSRTLVSVRSASVSPGVGSENGVLSVCVNLTTETATVVYDPDIIGVRAVLDAINNVGFEASLAKPGEWHFFKKPTTI